MIRLINSFATMFTESRLEKTIRQSAQHGNSCICVSIAPCSQSAPSKIDNWISSSTWFYQELAQSISITSANWHVVSRLNCWSWVQDRDIWRKLMVEWS